MTKLLATVLAWPLCLILLMNITVVQAAWPVFDGSGNMLLRIERGNSALYIILR